MDIDENILKYFKQFTVISCLNHNEEKGKMYYSKYQAPIKEEEKKLKIRELNLKLLEDPDNMVLEKVLEKTINLETYDEELGLPNVTIGINEHTIQEIQIELPRKEYTFFEQNMDDFDATIYSIKREIDYLVNSEFNSLEMYEIKEEKEILSKIFNLIKNVLKIEILINENNPHYDKIDKYFNNSLKIFNLIPENEILITPKNAGFYFIPKEILSIQSFDYIPKQIFLLYMGIIDKDSSVLIKI
jgi:hypothetical protein